MSNGNYGTIQGTEALEKLEILRQQVTDKKQRSKLKGLQDYLQRNQQYLINYDQRQQSNQTFTSQVAESHIDTVINARHKRDGKMQWSREGANSVLQIRAAVISAEWQHQVIGDREYRSTAFALWLTKKKIYFVLRLNKSTKIRSRYKKYQSLDSLDIKPGEKVLYEKVLVTEEKRKERFNVVVYWKRKYNNKQLPNPWYLLTNLENKDKIIKIFASRGGIEAMFRDCKSGGL